MTVLNGNTYTNGMFAGLGYAALFPEPIFTDMLAELQSWLDDFQALADTVSATNSFLFWNFDSSTAMADPGTGDIRLNHATLASVTAAAVSALSMDSGNPDFSDYINTFDTTGGTIILREVNTPTNFAIFTCGAVTDNTTWLEIALTFVSGSGSFANNDDLVMQFLRNGPAGSAGSIGPAGPTEFQIPGSDLTYSGYHTSRVAGEALTIWQACYTHTDAELYKADANGAGTYPVRALAAASISLNATGDFVLQGYVRDDSWNWTIGGAIYLSTTAGGMTQTAPSASGEIVQVLGYAVSADVMYFNPSPDYITRA